MNQQLKAAAAAGAQTAAAAAAGARAAAQEKLFAAGFAKMKISGHEDSSFSDAKKAGEVVVIVNPESYKKTYTSTTAGATKDGCEGTDNSSKNASGDPIPKKVIDFKETISFKLWYDSTGVFPDCKDVDAELKKLKKLLANFSETIHATNYTKIIWGDLVFMGQLDSITVDYLAFNRNGKPIRATADLSFSEFIDTKKEKSSPDLTHSRVVRAGDTLPLMCYRIYDDPNYYLQVAEANGLPHFTNIQPGQLLYFPPLKSE